MKSIVLLLVAAACLSPASAQNALVFQSDFGTQDAAVAAMKGVAYGVSAQLAMYDVTHEIPPFNVWEAAYRLLQTAEYWPAGTVFVSVVDPGVGTERMSVVLKTRSGHFFVTPDNGTLTLVAERLGVAELREIDEAVNRLRNSERSYTFHGRDVYAYTGARLAAGVITFEQVGRKLPARVVSIPYQRATFDDNRLRGNIPILDVQFGNIWTNIDRPTFERLGLQHGDTVRVHIARDGELIYEGTLPYAATFGGVPEGEPLLYLNSLNNVSLAVNQGSFAERYAVGSGEDWNIEISRSSPP